MISNGSPPPTLNVFINDKLLVNTLKTCNYLNKTVVIHYKVPLYQVNKLKIEIDSNGTYVQATFQYLEKYVSIVNARDRHDKIVFDGFSNPEDEAKTCPFIFSRFKQLKENHRLNVVDMAKRMEGDTIVYVYLNEAIMTESLLSKWYSRLWFKNAENDKQNETTVDHDHSLLEIINSRINEEPYCEYNLCNTSNNTQWAPVECKTGASLWEFRLVFNFISS
ncbi:hypothetical protein [Adoxophyes orana nucleopolyhedrovirus]|uniref:hypothetical protein n=1 Tax=Adoxophyes orana nucleopolyhedrovirus TaxID=542343 RepID=UPI0001829C43|nr:hypothetical protein [Adoxophyes orana nucleopolyhedrovirus]ACF05408.1 hypothetical protein [Adoxophyes orana nucleopolyhedrovirus]